MDISIADIAATIREKSRGVSFLSEIDLDETTLSCIRDNVFEILDSSTGSDDECIVQAFTLVDIEYQSYEEGKFWPHIDDARYRTSNGKACSALTNKERGRCIASFNRGISALGLKTADATYRNVEQILAHVFVPDYKMDDFFDFIRLYYLRILCGDINDLEKGLDQLSEFVNIRNCAYGTNQQIPENFPNPQKLLSCTRIALGIKEMSHPLMRKLFEIMDAGYRNQKSTFVEEGYDSRFVRAFRTWFENYFSKKKKKDIRNEYQKHPRLYISESNKIQVYIPPQRCEKEDRLTIEWNGTEFELPQPSKFPVSGTLYTSEHWPIVDQTNCGISAFDKFSILLGQKTIFKNRRKQNYILFNDQGFETTELSEGYNKILLKKGIEVGPNELITYRDNHIVQLYLQDGDVIHIGDTSLLVADPDRGENEIGIDPIRRVTALNDSRELNVVSDHRILFSITDDSGSVLVVRLSGLSEEKKPVLIDKTTPRYYRNGNRYSFEISLSDYFEETDIITVDVRSGDSRSICQSTFLYIPGFSLKFDKDYYLNEKNGILYVNDDESIEFNTGDRNISLPLKVKDREITLNIAIPAIYISFDSEEWIPPGNHSISVLKPNWDSLFVKTDVSRFIRLYIKTPHVNLEPNVQSEYTAFSLMDLRSAIEKDVMNGNKEYVISISLDHSPSRPLLRILAHNEYIFDKDKQTVDFKDLTGLPAKYFLKHDNRTTCESKLSPGLNHINAPGSQGISLTILEKNPYSGEFDVEMLTQILGSDAYIVDKEPGFEYVYKNNRITFSCNPDNKSAIEQEYESKMRFNPWMRDAKAKSTLMVILNHDDAPAAPPYKKRRKRISSKTGRTFKRTIPVPTEIPGQT